MTATPEACAGAGNVESADVLGIIGDDADADRRGRGRLPGDEVGQHLARDEGRGRGRLPGHEAGHALARDEVLGRKEVEPVALENDVVGVALVGAGSGGDVVAHLVDTLLAALALGHGPGIDPGTAVAAAGRGVAKTVAVVVDRAADGAGADRDSGRERDGPAVGGTSRCRGRYRPLEELVGAVVGKEGRRAVR